MSSPKAAVATQAGRFYEIELPEGFVHPQAVAPNVRLNGDTAFLPSVTNVLGSNAKPGLTWWAAGEVATFVLSQPGDVQELVEQAAKAEAEGERVCKACGKPTNNYLSSNDWWMHRVCEKAWKELRKQPFVKRDKKADLGSHVHDLIERHVLGTPVDPADYGEAAGHVASWLRFVEKHEPVFQMSEASVFNLQYGYAGTLDLIVDVGGSRWLVDVKTSPKVYEDHRIQLAAYRYAESIYIGPREIVDMPEVDDTAVLLITEEKYAFKPVVADRDTFERAFLPLLQLHAWKGEQN